MRLESGCRAELLTDLVFDGRAMLTTRLVRRGQVVVLIGDVEYDGFVARDAYLCRLEDNTKACVLARELRPLSALELLARAI